MANRPPHRPGNNPPRRGPKPGGSASRPPQRRPSNQAAPGPRTDRDRRREQGREGGEDGGLERLQKVLAHAGVSSRRACEELILQGRITVDGQVVRELGTKVDPRKQQVAVDGQKVHSERNVYYAVHKPKGYVSTNSDPSGKPLVINLLPEIPQRAYAVGRLDEQSTGLMLLTNDGELANKLAHPKFGVEKIYRVVVAGEPGREVLDQLTQGIWLAEGKVRAKRVKVTGHKGQSSVLEMVLAEGKNREIRRMLAKLGHKVMSLTRIAVGPIGLKGLGVGECRPLTGQEID
ncbi:MAG: rRNA pseudouridine synthase, partial [Planctomycetia bacterium]|nr:rRNA pseudouridine synthase [Planctomycetia bacterium]